MKNLLIVLLFVVFALHFTAEVFVNKNKVQKQINNLAFTGLVLFFVVAILSTIFVGI